MTGDSQWLLDVKTWSFSHQWSCWYLQDNNRQATPADLGVIDELANNISEVGLLHPIVILPIMADRRGAKTGSGLFCEICRRVQVAVQLQLVHAVAMRANMRSILVAMMKSFSCSPLIFLVCSETVALPQPKLIFG